MGTEGARTGDVVSVVAFVPAALVEAVWWAPVRAERLGEGSGTNTPFLCRLLNCALVSLLPLLVRNQWISLGINLLATASTMSSQLVALSER